MPALRQKRGINSQKMRRVYSVFLALKLQKFLLVGGEKNINECEAGCNSGSMRPRIIMLSRFYAD